VSGNLLHFGKQMAGMEYGHAAALGPYTLCGGTLKLSPHTAAVVPKLFQTSSTRTGVSIVIQNHS
jgi:hypothetical protein